MRPPLYRVPIAVRISWLALLLAVLAPSAGRAQEPTPEPPAADAATPVNATPQIAPAATRPAPSCPDPAALVDAQVRLEDSLRTQAERIRTVLDGGQINTPLVGLFTIDLADPAAVQRRARELNELVAGTRSEPTTLAACGAETDAIRARQIALARLRLAFLSLPPERRASLGNLQSAAQTHEDTAQRLSADRREAEAAGTQAAEAQAVAEDAALTARTADERRLAAQRALVEKARREIGEGGASWLGGLEEQVAEYQRVAAQLSDVAARVGSDVDAATVRDAYDQATRIWTSVAREAASLGAPTMELEAPRLPAIPTIEAAAYASLPEWQEYQSARTKLDAEYAALLQRIFEKTRQQSSMHYRLLDEAARLRAQMLEQASSLGDIDLVPISSQTAEHIALELKVVPYRWRTAIGGYTTRLRGLLASGDVNGMVAIAQELAVAAELALIVALLLFGGRLVTHWVGRAQGALLVSRQHRSRSRSAAVWIRRAQPYIPWALAWIVLGVAQQVSGDSEFAWVQSIIPLIRYYLLYRVALIVVHESLLASRGERRELRTRARLRGIETSVRLFARFVLGAVTVAYVVEMLVGRLLVYELVTAIAFYLCIALLVWFAWRAREWLASSARERLGGRVGDIAAYLCGDWRVVVFGIPVALALAVAAALRYAIEVGSEFDFGKRLSARMFIRRAQAQKRAGHSPASQPLPADYVASFDLYHTPEPEMLVEPETGDYEGLRASVESWRGGDDTTNSLALFGHKGTGKSTLLERLGSDWGELRVIAGKVHGKCTKVDDVAKLLGDLLQCDMSSGMGGFLESVAKMPPTLVLLDDAHNLVLRTQGGFGGFRLLASLINANTPNLYWCAAFNLYPWRYLENVFAQELPFRSTHAVHGWSDTDIERLITRRHASTGYRLRFDDVILASDNEAHDYVESRFFQVLWEQSHGIPRSALALWRRSLLYNGSRTLRVTLPEIGDASRASSLSTEALFVLAAVVRHENLTATEAMEVTGISQSLVRHALSSARELGLVERGEDRRYRVAPDWYALLARVLSDRNLIYE